MDIFIVSILILGCLSLLCCLIGFNLEMILLDRLSKMALKIDDDVYLKRLDALRKNIDPNDIPYVDSRATFDNVKWYNFFVDVEKLIVFKKKGSY